MKEAQEEIKLSLEDKIKANIKAGLKAKAINEKEIERLQARNKTIEENLEALTTAYEENKFVDASEIDTFVANQTNEMNEGFIVGAGGRKLRM